jgi:hypothetical protein
MTKLFNRLVPMFEGEGGGGGTPPVVTTPPVTPVPQGKTFSEEYVVTLREENKQFRLNSKANETHLRTLLGVKDGDITAEQITAFQTSQSKLVTEAMSKANDRLVSAEIRSLEGYNHKLLEKLIDRSKVTIDDKGEIVGLKEAAEAIALEFPDVKKALGAGSGGINPAGGGAPSTLQQLESDYAEAVKSKNFPLQLAISDKIFALQSKK